MTVFDDGTGEIKILIRGLTFSKRVIILIAIRRDILIWNRRIHMKNFVFAAYYFYFTMAK